MNEVDVAVTSGHSRLCILYKIFYTGPKEKQKKTALMMVDVDGANVPLVLCLELKRCVNTVHVCMVQLCH